MPTDLEKEKTPRQPTDLEKEKTPAAVVETAATATTGASNADLVDADISSKTFRYNPPMHSSNLSKRVDLGNVGVKKRDFYDEDSAPASYKEKWAKEGLNTLRLGRIIQHYLAPGQVSLMKHRWGFRFLYNPSSVSYMSTRNDTFIIDPRSETNNVLSGVNQNFQNISFTVLLDRLPDVMSGIPDVKPYSPALTAEDLNGIKRWGTHWDMEALFKVCNGEWELTDRGKTSNIGILMPSNARLILGPGVNFYGFISNVTWKDEMFAGNMVPVRTRLDISFRRHVDMTAEDAESAFPGIASSDTSGGAPNPATDPATADGQNGNPKDAPLPGYNTVTTPYGKRGDIWSAGYHQGDDYGLGGVVGKSIITTRDGTIKHIAHNGSGGWGSWAGNHVVVSTGGIEHGYCHMQSINSGLQAGRSIAAGTAVGRVGRTGHVTGNHLHYEERVGGRPRKPIWNNK